MKYHYVYRITNVIKNKHYYGCRSCDCEPTEDLGIIYFSSSYDKDFIKDQTCNPQDYKYKILKLFPTRKHAIQYEIMLHKKFDVGINESFYNIVKQTSSGFDYTGRRHSKQTKLKISQNTSKALRKKFDSIYQYDLNGNYIRKFEVLRDTIKFFGVTSAVSNIRKCIEYPHRKYKNSLWRNQYFDKVDPYFKPKLKWFHNPLTKESQKINVNKPNWEEDIIDGFIAGVLQEQCPHCGKSGNFNSMRTKHFDNCKMKQQKETEYVCESCS